MAKPRSALSVCAFYLAACAPSANMESEDANTLIDMVVMREGPFHGCVMVRSEVGLIAEYPDEYPGTGMGRDFAELRDGRAVVAARRIAISFDQAMKQEQSSRIIQLVGEPDNSVGECAMMVSYPLFSGDFAFLDYYSPSGDVGSYVFERNYARWYVNQRVHLGWW